LQPPDSDQYHSHSPERSHIEYTQIPSPIYQYVISLLVSLPIRRGPGELVNVSVQEHRAVVELMDIIAMWLIDIFFSFCGIVVCKS